MWFVASCHSFLFWPVNSLNYFVPLSSLTHISQVIILVYRIYDMFIHKWGLDQSYLFTSRVNYSSSFLYVILVLSTYYTKNTFVFIDTQWILTPANSTICRGISEILSILHRERWDWAAWTTFKENHFSWLRGTTW